MKLYLLSDLHLPFANNIRLSAFGAHWEDHEVQMQRHWDALVAPEDIVLVPGDISWASTPKRAQADWEWLSARPGTKWVSRGNHDRWWRHRVRLDATLPDDIVPVYEEWVPFHGGIIGSVMGMTAPDDKFFNVHAEKRWPAAVKKLQGLLDELPAARARHAPAFILLMMHYPPCFVDGRPNALGEAIVFSGVDLCVYGHIHQPSEWQQAWNGRIGDTEFRLGSGDALGFRPICLASLHPFELLPAETPCALLSETAAPSSPPEPSSPTS